MNKVWTLAAVSLALWTQLNHAEDPNDAVSSNPAVYSQDPPQPPRRPLDLHPTQLARAEATPVMKDDPWIVPFNPDDMLNPDDWKRQFDVVVVIDKNPHVQRGWIFKSGNLVKTVPVSTGRDQVEYPNPDKIDNVDALQFPTVSRTYTGYYTPSHLIIDAKSKTYKDAPMPHAVFFNWDEKEASHQAPFKTEQFLGRQVASGGCVRMTANDARDLFWSARATGGPVTDEETGGLKPKDETKGKMFRDELAQEKAHNQFTTYDSMPSIPVFDIHGRPKKDEDGNLVTRTGTPEAPTFKTLYIIEDSSNKPDKQPSVDLK